MHWIFDTDAGVDDAIAFAIPFAPGRFPEFKLLAVTTVAGNCSLEKVNLNVGAVLDALGSSAPIYSGCDRPLIEAYQDAADFHGSDGLGDVGLAVTQRRPEREHGAQALVRLAREYAGDIGVIALGPLTNIALACNLDPDFAKNVKTFCVMGGAWRAQGNQSSAGEFNIVVDPESAKVVFERFADTLLVPWEVSLDGLFPYERMNALETIGTPRAGFYHKMTRMGVKTLAEVFKLPGFPLPDPLAVAAMLDPSTIKRELRACVKVDIGHDAGRALTTLDFRRGAPNARVVIDMHYDRAFELIEAGLRGG
jgi:purine nucleosidase